MRRLLSALAPPAIAAALTVATAPPAAAGFVCAGTAATVVACVNTDELALEPWYVDCVYLGGPECVPVVAVRPGFGGSGGCLVYWGGEVGRYLFGPCR